ncbi:general substrate transporter [Fusarium albosuccineum]|uniref:General substrate transporter n=1 Tax=Fusarium albosuccineum TaxID=1237068 RepID=A0A8H4P5X9_9HYPO|nr:general substrate transporter [Fusarium albosuccineum]
MAKHEEHRHYTPSDTRVENAEHPKIIDLLPDYGKSWYRVPHLLKLNALLLVPLLTSYVSGFDGSVINGFQSLPHWNEDLDYPSGSALGLISTIQVIGGLAALPFAPMLADRFGRRPAILIGSLFIIAGAVLQGAGHTIGTFLGGRGLVGWGSSFIAVAAAPMIGELAYPSHRPIITAIYNTSWYLGSIVAAWVTYGTFKIPSGWSWRIPCLLQAAPSLVQVAFIYLVPESPRWLVAHDRPEEAQEILCRYHAGSEEPNELVLAEMNEIKIAIQNETLRNTSSYLKTSMSLDLYDRAHQRFAPSSCLLTCPEAGNRHRLFICISIGFIIQWCGNGLVSVYPVQVLKSIGITDPETQNIINGVLQIFNYIVALASAFFVDRFGRRGLFLFSIAGMTLSFIIWTAISARNEQQNFENKGLGIGVITMIFIFFLFYNIAMIPVPMAYLLEVLPYTLRAKGLTIFNVSQFASVVFNGFANPVALKAIGWKYYIVFACLLVVWFFVVFFAYPETRRLSLEEVAVVFDGEDAMREVDAKAVVKKAEEM